MSPFLLPQQGLITNSSYIQETDTEQDEGEANGGESNGNSVILLSYNPSCNQGRIMNISQTTEATDDAAEESEKSGSEISEKIADDPKDSSGIESEKSMEEPPSSDENKHVSYENAIAQDISDIRMIQLASNIANDMGMTMRITVNR